MKNKKAKTLLTEDDLLISDIIGDLDLETSEMPDAKAIRRQAKREFKRIGQREQLLEIIPQPPRPNTSIHIVGTGLYDFWTFVPQIISWLGDYAEEMYCSTRTVNRNNVIELFSLMDAGKVDPKHTAFLTGEYFKRRESAVYAYLVEGLRQRGGRFRCFLNHAKVLLVKRSKTFLVCEGSANLTANPRLEQYVFTNDQALYEFHKAWMEEMLSV